MPFTIPNLADAADPMQAQVDKVDLDIVVAGSQMSGVISGCAVTAQGTPDMTVAVAAGLVSINGLTAVVTAGNVTITAANATNPRFDLVSINKFGFKFVQAGTPAAAPVFPAIVTDTVIVAAVFVPANDTAINANQIVDKRVPVAPQMHPRLKTGSAYYIIPQGQQGAGTLTQGLMRSVPILLPGGITLDRISMEVTTASAGTTARLGIYADSGYGYPGALMLDAGTIDASTTGMKEITISQAITIPGVYWLVCAAQGSGGTGSLRTFNNPIWSLPIITSFTALPTIGTSTNSFEVTSGVSGALPDPFASVPLTLSTAMPRIVVRVA